MDARLAKVNVVIRKASLGMQIEEADHPDPPPEIQQILEES